MAIHLRRKTPLNFEDDIYNGATEHAIPAIVRRQETVRIKAIDKTSQFCSLMNMLTKNNFAILTITLDDGYGYRVVKLSKADDHLVDCYFVDFGGKLWKIQVSEFQRFSVFRGV